MLFTYSLHMYLKYSIVCKYEKTIRPIVKDIFIEKIEKVFQTIEKKFKFYILGLFIHFL